MFCPNCGFNAGDARFCPSCGSAMLVSVAAQVVQGAAAQSAAPRAAMMEEVLLWEGKPAGIPDKAKGLLNSTKYKITNQRIIITEGIVNTSETEIELRRIKDFKVNQTLSDKIAKVGDITIISTDAMDDTFVLRNVNDPIAVKEILRSAYNAVVQNMNVLYREQL